MTREVIQEAINRLPLEQQRLLVIWIQERDSQAWEEQLERDFSKGGRGMPLLEEVERQIAEDKKP